MQFEFNFPYDLNYTYSKKKCKVLKRDLSEFLKYYNDYFGYDLNKVNDYEHFSISALKTAYQCPLLFKAFTVNDNFKTNFLHIPQIFSIGSLFDKFCRKFIKIPVSERIKTHKTLRQEFERELSKKVDLEKEFPIKTELKDDENATYLEAFDNFCETFKHSKFVESQGKFREDKKLNFKVVDINFSGKIDLLVQNSRGEGNVLIDLKLKKFGASIKEFKIEEFVQVLFYARALKELGVKLDALGYYYGVDNTLIYIDVRDFSLSEFQDVTNGLILNLKHAKDFYPVKCELCLICPLKSNCKIGKKLNSSSFKTPLY